MVQAQCSLRSAAESSRTGMKPGQLSKRLERTGRGWLLGFRPENGRLDAIPEDKLGPSRARLQDDDRTWVLLSSKTVQLYRYRPLSVEWFEAFLNDELGGDTGAPSRCAPVPAVASLSAERGPVCLRIAWSSCRRSNTSRRLCIGGARPDAYECPARSPFGTDIWRAHMAWVAGRRGNTQPLRSSRSMCKSLWCWPGDYENRVSRPLPPCVAGAAR